MFNHRVQNRQQFSHASNQSDLCWFTRLAQPCVESFDDGITSAGGQGSHVERCPHAGTTAPDATTASERTAIAIERGDSHQGSNLFTVELAEFREISDQRAAGHRADTWSALKQVLFLLPNRALTDSLVQVLIDSLQFRLQPADVSVDTFFDAFGGTIEAVMLSTNHLNDLPPASNQRAQFQANLIGQRPDCGTYSFSEAGQYPGIDGIGLGQLSGGFGEVSNLARVNNHHRQFRTGQSTSDLAFDSAGGFQHDQGRLHLSQPFDQHLDTRFIVGKRVALSQRPHSHIQTRLGHVNTNKDTANFQNSFLLDFSFLQPGSTLRMMRALLTQATVRAFGEAERNDPC